jgi:tripartite-type tricarboxylate transporter receptor subunit TctC
MQPSRRQVLPLVMSAAVLAAAPQVATAQDLPVETWPTRPIRLLVGFVPGGVSDAVARIIAQWLSERLGEQVAVETRSGAGSNIAAQVAIGSPADGYTLLMATGSNAVNATFYDALPFNFLRDTDPVAGLIHYPLVMVVHPSVPAGTVAEFIDHAKAGKLVMASFGTGSAGHLAGELFKAITGVDMVHVPYDGEGPAMADVMDGKAQMMFASVPGAIEHINAGRLRALGVGSPARWHRLPRVPAVAETLPGFEARTWAGIVAPQGTPPYIIERLSAEIDAGLADPDVRARLGDIGAAPMILGPADFGRFIADETEKWGRVVRLAGVKAE